jgi:hypothetical protein
MSAVTVSIFQLVIGAISGVTLLFFSLFNPEQLSKVSRALWYLFLFGIGGGILLYYLSVAIQAGNQSNLLYIVGVFLLWLGIGASLGIYIFSVSVSDRLAKVLSTLQTLTIVCYFAGIAFWIFGTYAKR